MTKVQTISKFQIDDVIWNEHSLFAYFSRPGDTEAGEHDYIKVPLSDFYEFLETNNHLVAMVPMPYLTADGYENDPQPSNIMPEEFRLMDNSHTWPIIHEYLRSKNAFPCTNPSTQQPAS